jgi:hypothetical protein
MIGAVFAFGIAIGLVRAYLQYHDIALALFAALAFGVGVLLTCDWIAARLCYWIQEFGSARIYHLKEVALALGRMSPQGLELFRTMALTELDLITGPGDEPTLVNIVCVNGRIPAQFIADYLKASEHTWPYLLAVRDAKRHEALEAWPMAEDLASMLTHKLIEDGIADSFNGRFAAMVRDKYDAAYIRAKYHVD